MKSISFLASVRLNFLLLLIVGVVAVTGCSPSDPKNGQTDTTPPGLALKGALPQLGADKTGVTVSGVSAGAFMATQLQIAYSSTFVGVASIAGGPWNCASGSAWNATGRCMEKPDQINVPSLLLDLSKAQDRGLVDATENLKRIRVYLLNASSDSVVRPPMADKVSEFYQALVPSTQMHVERALNAEHSFPTLDYGRACNELGAPYLNACGFDTAGALLKTLYPDRVLTRVSSKPENLHVFKQDEFNSTFSSLSEEGWVYIPDQCATNNSKCAIHLALHGCSQGSDAVKDVFARHAGYNEWAEGSGIIVLYPQTYARPLTNPKGCFDWFGYTGSNYATKDGHQMKALKAMIDRLVSGPSR